MFQVNPWFDTFDVLLWMLDFDIPSVQLEHPKFDFVYVEGVRLILHVDNVWCSK
jgi:hypothetical protein